MDGRMDGWMDRNVNSRGAKSIAVREGKPSVFLLSAKGEKKEALITFAFSVRGAILLYILDSHVRALGRGRSSSRRMDERPLTRQLASCLRIACILQKSRIKKARALAA